MYNSIKHKFYDIKLFEELESTNDYAKKCTEDNLVIWAKSQTVGKGRLGRSWNNHPGEALTFSIRFTPDIATYNAPMLTLVAAMAVARAIGEDCKIKWPNDIVINGRKVTGILTELCGVAGNMSVIIGIGINVNTMEFEEELKTKATSIKREYGVEVNQEELLGKVLDEFYNLYHESFETCQDMSLLLNEYNSRLVNLNRHVKVVGDEETEGECLGINNSGELKVLKNDGTIITVRSGEVSVRGLDGYV